MKPSVVLSVLATCVVISLPCAAQPPIKPPAAGLTAHPPVTPHVPHVAHGPRPVAVAKQPHGLKVGRTSHAPKLVEMQDREPTLYPDVIETLTSLREKDGYLLAVATNNSGGRAIRNNRRLGVDQLFDDAHIIGARDESGEYRPGVRGKPEPDILRLAVSSLNASGAHVEPSTMAYVGDSPLDMIAARRYGSLAIGIAHGSSTEGELRQAGAHVVVRSFREVPAAIRAAAKTERVKIKAAVFDMDGTYVDSWQEYEDSVAEALAAIGTPKSGDEVRAFLQRRAFSTKHDAIAAWANPSADEAYEKRFRDAFNYAYNLKSRGTVASAKSP